MSTQELTPEESFTQILPTRMGGLCTCEASYGLLFREEGRPDRWCDVTTAISYELYQRFVAETKEHYPNATLAFAVKHDPFCVLGAATEFASWLAKQDIGGVTVGIAQAKEITAKAHRAGCILCGEPSDALCVSTDPERAFIYAICEEHHAERQAGALDEDAINEAIVSHSALWAPKRTRTIRQPRRARRRHE